MGNPVSSLVAVVHQGHSDNGDAAVWWAVMSVSEVLEGDTVAIHSEQKKAPGRERMARSTSELEQLQTHLAKVTFLKHILSFAE